MLKLLKALIGGSAYSANPVATGAQYLRDSLLKSGMRIDQMPSTFYDELAEYAHTFAQDMALVSSRDKPVTYFVEHLDYILGVLQDAIDGEVVDVPEPLRDILVHHGLKATTSI